MSKFILLFIFLNLSSSLKIENVINSKFFNLLQITDKYEELIDITQYEHINPNNPNYFYIPIFSTSDIHGHFYPDEYDVGKHFLFKRWIRLSGKICKHY